MTGAELIAQERKEQIEKHGLDDTHIPRKILTMAALFCINNVSLPLGSAVRSDNYPFNRLPIHLLSNVQRKRDRMDDTEYQLEMLKLAGAFIAASIDKLLPKEQTFYRVANIYTQQGLWYDINGNFTGIIHDKLNFCTNNALPMPYEPQVKGWLSATKTLEELYHWFSKEDIEKLRAHDYRVYKYKATEYKFFNNHWLIKQSSSQIVDEELNTVLIN